MRKHPHASGMLHFPDNGFNVSYSLETLKTLKPEPLTQRLRSGTPPSRRSFSVFFVCFVSKNGFWSFLARVLGGRAARSRAPSLPGVHFRCFLWVARRQEPGAKSQEPGARSQEPRARSQELGGRSQEPGAMSQEPKARSQEPGASSQELRARSQELGARS